MTQVSAVKRVILDLKATKDYKDRRVIQGLKEIKVFRVPKVIRG